MAHKIGELIGYFIAAFILVTMVWGAWHIVCEIGWLKITLVSLIVAAILAVWSDNDGT